MNKTFIVKGMHCEACELLISMELEEKEIEVLETKLNDDDHGTVVIVANDEATVAKAERIINNADHYKVISKSEVS